MQKAKFKNAVEHIGCVLSYNKTGKGENLCLISHKYFCNTQIFMAEFLAVKRID
jgi:hypothetical protein